LTSALPWVIILLEADKMLKIYRAGDDAYFINNYEGRLTTKQAKALIETRFGIRLTLEKYTCTIETFAVGRDKYCNATFLRKKRV
jgi:hypothetical protein